MNRHVLYDMIFCIRGDKHCHQNKNHQKNMLSISMDSTVTSMMAVSKIEGRLQLVIIFGTPVKLGSLDIKQTKKSNHISERTDGIED